MCDMDALKWVCHHVYMSVTVHYRNAYACNDDLISRCALRVLEVDAAEINARFSGTDNTDGSTLT